MTLGLKKAGGVNNTEIVEGVKSATKRSRGGGEGRCGATDRG